ncbi:hypothetical protein ACCO45_007010 [Purpureocillium lilacinum]|uniref:Uncharacterized protein n=1 Tax=Purpureocillium lilacinum TaxID=33203 RepID=A0ACC4DS55_PURLI
MPRNCTFGGSGLPRTSGVTKGIRPPPLAFFPTPFTTSRSRAVNAFNSSIHHGRRRSSPDALTREEFDALLAQYPPLVESISKAKGSRPKDPPGARPLPLRRRARRLGAHDDHRNSNDNSSKPGRAMTLDDVKLLVEWKLRHGKFRPTLMSLISSNPAPSSPPPSPPSSPPTAPPSLLLPPPFPHRLLLPPLLPPLPTPPPATAGALLALCSLRGVGPATASLLLSVHDPRRAPFFSDEAFLWLCAGANPRAPIKYVEKEYRALRERAAESSCAAGRVGAGSGEGGVCGDEGLWGRWRGCQGEGVEEDGYKGEAKVEKPPVKRKSILKEVDKDIDKGKDAPTTAEPGVRRSKRLKS